MLLGWWCGGSLRLDPIDRHAIGTQLVQPSGADSTYRGAWDVCLARSDERLLRPWKAAGDVSALCQSGGGPNRDRGGG